MAQIVKKADKSYKQRSSTRDRRRVLVTLAALAGSKVNTAFATFTTSLNGSTADEIRSDRRITQMIGANGWPENSSDLQMWRNMGISWGRDSVGPGQPYSVRDPMQIVKTGPNFTDNLPSIVRHNNRGGIRSLLLLGYTPRWNASVDGDTRSAPKDEWAWEHYVEAVVRKYSAPPYNVTHFQVWNEAAGALSGGEPQASFWHGQGYSPARGLSKPYEKAMRDYVERIHIPAARIIRKYSAYVVYGGWPDQGGLDTFIKWLEYRSPMLNSRMLDWVDYIDTHYLDVDDLDVLYERYVENGPAIGIWQTEIGDRYMSDPHYLPLYYFKFAVWALERNWNDPDRYVSMIYHWDGSEPFRLTRRGTPRTYNVSGMSLLVLRNTVSGALRQFSAAIVFGPDVSGLGLYSGVSLIFQVRAAAGWRTVDIDGLTMPPSRCFVATVVDALTGIPASADTVTTKSLGSKLSIRFKVPEMVNGGPQTPRTHLAYLVVTPRA